MEALALGLPIVATDVGGVAEALSDGRDALLVPPGRATALADALGSVVADPLLRTRLGKAAADRALEFDVGRTVATIEAIYSAHSTAKTPATSSRRPPAGPTRTPSGTDIRRATPDDRPAVLELLGRSLGTADDPRYPQLFAWKHDQNPFGASPMWVATVAGRVVAFRTFMRWEFERGDDVLRAVRAVDTATAPEHQGRGLFTALTTAGLEQLRSEGVDLVFNTPNESSRPGYLKMGWRDVGRLPAAVRFARPSSALRAMRSRVPAERWSNELTIGEPFHDWLAGDVPLPEIRPPIDVREIRTRASAEFLSWRYGSPLLGYRVVEDEGATVIVRERTRGAASELAVVATFGDPAAADRLAGRTLTAGRADYAIRLGPSRPLAGFVPLPRGGPMLTWRGLGDAGPPPLSNWALTLGDIELF